MFHIFRIIYLYSRNASHTLFQPVIYRARVKLWDIDGNMHLTNSKYLRYLDMGRLECLLRTGLFKRLIPMGVRPVVSAVDISYVREIKPFERFEIETQLLGWDDKFLYFRQDIFGSRDSGSGKLRASTHSRICPLLKGKRVPIAELMVMINEQQTSPKLPNLIENWRADLSQKRYGLEGKRPSA